MRCSADRVHSVASRDYVFKYRSASSRDGVVLCFHATHAQFCSSHRCSAQPHTNTSHRHSIINMTCSMMLRRAVCVAVIVVLSADSLSIPTLLKSEAVTLTEFESTLTSHLTLSVCVSAASTPKPKRSAYEFVPLTDPDTDLHRTEHGESSAVHDQPSVYPQPHTHHEQELELFAVASSSRPAAHESDDRHQQIRREAHHHQHDVRSGSDRNAEIHAQPWPASGSADTDALITAEAGHVRNDGSNHPHASHSIASTARSRSWSSCMRRVGHFAGASVLAACLIGASMSGQLVSTEYQHTHSHSSTRLPVINSVQNALIDYAPEWPLHHTHHDHRQPVRRESASTSDSHKAVSR